MDISSWSLRGGQAADLSTRVTATLETNLAQFHSELFDVLLRAITLILLVGREDERLEEPNCVADVRLGLESWKYGDDIS